MNSSPDLPKIVASPRPNILYVDTDLISEEKIAELTTKLTPTIIRYSGKQAKHLGIEFENPIHSGGVPLYTPFDQYWIGELQAEVKALKEKLANTAGDRTIITDIIDSEWLRAIGEQSIRVLGRPWETRDGETREEGLKVNISALFQIIEDMRNELLRLRDLVGAVDAAIIDSLLGIKNPETDPTPSPTS